MQKEKIGLYDRLARRFYRKLKKTGKLKPDDFDKSELVALIDGLKKFYQKYLNWEACNSIYGGCYVARISEAIRILELILSDDTNFGSEEWKFI